MNRPGRLPLSIAALAALLFAPSLAFACSVCRCDDPAVVVPGDERFIGRNWRASLETDVNSKDQISEDGVNREKETELRWTLTGSWTFRPRLAVLARVPWSTRRIQDGEELPLTRSGLGDPEFAVGWHVVNAPGAKLQHWVTAQFGVRAPWGMNNVEVDGQRADEHLQPGTGAAGAHVGLAGFVRLSARDVTYASLLGRVNGTNSHGYRYGDAFVGSGAVQHELKPWLQGTLELDYRLAAADQVDGVTEANTGGGVLYLTPRLQFGLSSRVSLRVGAQIPVASALYGDQREFANFHTSLVLLP